MKKEEITELFNKFENACYVYQDIECWSARELMEILGYTKWQNFEKIIDKAIQSLKNAGETALDHFTDVSNMVQIGSGGVRALSDIALTRYACYVVAQNGDPNKPEIAFAQTYFAVQTRKQELVEQRLLDVARVNARAKLTKSEKKLSEILFSKGIDEKGFAHIRSQGDKALFGGKATLEMKKKLLVPDSRPMADFLPTLLIKAKDFATELTSHNVVEKDLEECSAITEEHITNNTSVRKILLKRGVKPENLPPGEDIKKVQRRLDTETKKVCANTKKIKPRKK